MDESTVTHLHGRTERPIDTLQLFACQPSQLSAQDVRSGNSLHRCPVRLMKLGLSQQSCAVTLFVETRKQQRIPKGKTGFTAHGYCLVKNYNFFLGQG